MKENELAKILVDVFYRLHVKFGPGLLESVYEELICYELEKLGINYERQKPVELWHDGKIMGIGFRADVIVENKVIVEIKSVETLHPVHPKQLKTYLRLTNLKLGLLVNFNVNLVKTGIMRVANGMED